jgi:hypothetical protein
MDQPITMTTTDYAQDFYTQYQEYLREPLVVARHSRALKMLLPDEYGDWPEHILDLGCGLYDSYGHTNFFELTPLHCGTPKKYLGVDVNIDSRIGKYQYTERSYIKSDYRKIGIELLKGYEIFVSLFSSEITATTEANYELYRKLIGTAGFNRGIVSGFYYTDKKDTNPIVEAGGVTSFQTLEPIEAVECPEFTEYRLIFPLPSKMFGPNVVEVWKLFERK